jgi:hypothetical protein
MAVELRRAHHHRLDHLGAHRVVERRRAHGLVGVVFVVQHHHRDQHLAGLVVAQHLLPALRRHVHPAREAGRPGIAGDAAIRAGAQARHARGVGRIGLDQLFGHRAPVARHQSDDRAGLALVVERGFGVRRLAPDQRQPDGRANKVGRAVQRAEETVQHLDVHRPGGQAGEEGVELVEFGRCQGGGLGEVVHGGERITGRMDSG